MVDVTKTRSRRRSGGRDARAAARTQPSASQAIWPGLSGGRYRPLSDADMQKIHNAALTILERTGIGDPTEELLDLVLPKGAILSEHGRLCFPRALMEDLLAGAANEFYVHARGSRAGKDDMHCTKDKVYYANSGTAVTTFDAASRSYRPSIIRDVYDFTRLVDRLDNIHMTGDTVLGTDVPQDFEHDMSMLYSILAGSEKPSCLTFRDRFPHQAGD